MPARRLPWFKLESGTTSHPKVATLSDAQFRVWVEMLDAASRQPRRGMFGSIEEAAAVIRRPSKAVQSLVGARLVDVREDGVWMHDWSEWQDRYPSDLSANALPTLLSMVVESSANAPSTLPNRSAESSDKIKKEEKEVHTPQPPEGPDLRVDKIYAHFKAKVQPRSRMCPDRKIAARLKRFSADELMLGIDNFAADWWEMENNASRGADWFFEKDQRSEHFLLMTPRTKPTPGNGRAEPLRRIVDHTGCEAGCTNQHPERAA